MVLALTLNAVRLPLVVTTSSLSAYTKRPLGCAVTARVRVLLAGDGTAIAAVGPVAVPPPLLAFAPTLETVNVVVDRTVAIANVPSKLVSVTPAITTVAPTVKP